MTVHTFSQPVHTFSQPVHAFSQPVQFLQSFQTVGNARESLPDTFASQDFIGNRCFTVQTRGAPVVFEKVDLRMSDATPITELFVSGTGPEGSSLIGPSWPPVVGVPPHGTTDSPLHAEDLRIGQMWRSPSRAITAADVRAFAKLTGDDDPLHDEVDSGSPFGQPVAHGLLGLSVLAGLGVEHPRTATLALVGITDWQFNSPIYFGQCVYVETTLEQMEPHGRRACKAVWLRRLVAESGRTLQCGRFVTLVAARRRSPR